MILLKTKEITRCGTCPFNNSNGEYGDTCNHPLNNNFNLESPDDYPNPIEKISTEETSWGFYHDETCMIPKTCPLRNINKINLGNFEMSINLDNRLFEENFKDTPEG